MIKNYIAWYQNVKIIASYNLIFSYKVSFLDINKLNRRIQHINVAVLKISLALKSFEFNQRFQKTKDTITYVHIPREFAAYFLALVQKNQLFI